MKFINPREISGKIMTLIDNAEEKLVLISPYVAIEKWEKMCSCLQKAVGRGVKIEFFTRTDSDSNYYSLRRMGIQPILVDYLHAKLYYNEKYAIVTSQNMVKASDDRSIDLAYETETVEELRELEKFRKIYLLNDFQRRKELSVGSNLQPANPLVFINNESLPNHKNINNQAMETGGIDLSEPLLTTLHERLKKAFPSTGFNKARDYIFSGYLIYGADIMIFSDIVIKFTHNPTYLAALKGIDIHNLNVPITIEVETDHNKYTYCRIKLQQKLDFESFCTFLLRLSGLINEAVQPVVGARRGFPSF